MRRSAVVFLILLAALPLARSAQQTNTESSLTDTQKLGRRVFQRQCAVCHERPLITSRRYAAVLYKDMVDGKEDAIREIIRKGRTGVMPGFQYGLKPSEIDATIEYLKTVPKPARPGRTGNNQTPMD